MLNNSGTQEVKGSLFRLLGSKPWDPPQKAVGGCRRTCSLGPWGHSLAAGAKVELQVEVFHHVAQLIVVGVLPELRGRGGSE